LTGGGPARSGAGEPGEREQAEERPELTSGTDEEYRSPFRTWYERASVRSTPRRMLPDAGEPVGHLFPPELVPVVRHPLVQALPEGCFDEVIVRQLYRYLDFTAKLEYLVVNRTVLGIAHGSVGVELPEEMRFDALKMYCDEAYHALFSVDLMRQVKARTDVEPRLGDQPYFLSRLQQLNEELDQSERGLTELLFVVVSETLISASLAEIPASDGVSETVRSAIRDHASDEGRHHAYFAAFLRHLWGQLSSAERRLAGQLVPRLAAAFLEPDLASIGAELTGYGLSRDEVACVLAEVYSPETVAEHARLTARHSLRYFEELGAFAAPEAQAGLVAYGFAGTSE
jgi:hypothetical protein